MSVEINTLKHGRQRHRRPSTKSLARQRGAIGILGASVLLLSVLFTALAVDTGRLMLEQRRLQTVADMAALDASSQSGSCGDGTLATAQAAAIASALRNNHPVSGARTLAVDLGNTSTGDDGVRSFISGNPETAMSVRVAAGNTVPASLFAGGIFGEQATLQASAVAERLALAGFSGGSGLVSLNTRDSAFLNMLLGGILGSAVDLDLVSYKGIAATNVTLLELVKAAAGVGTVEELLKAELSVGELLQIYADAVSSAGVANVDVLVAMQTLIDANISSLPDISLGDILSVTAPSADAAASVNVNLLDLITTTVLVASNKHAITLAPNINLLGLNIAAVLHVIEPPQIAIGPPGKDEYGEWRTRMHTAQVRLDIRVQGSVNLLVAQTEVDLSLKVEAAQGSAWLASIQCRSQQNPKSIVTIGAQPGIATIDLASASDPSAPAVVHVKLLGARIADLDLGLSLPLENPRESDLIYKVNTNDVDALPMVQRASSSLGGSLGNGLSGLADSLQINVTLLGGLSLDLDGILRAVLGKLLAPLLSQIGTAVLDPLLRILGIQAGFLDVQLFMLDIDRPALLI